MLPHKLSIYILLFFLTFNASGWGITGHRVIGKIAEMHLSKRVKKKLTAILSNESLAEVSTWMDEIRSDRQYDHTHDWHWVTIPDEMTYQQTEKNKNGDIIASIERLIKELKSGGLTEKQETEHLKMLIHLVGDIHQPLHVGTGKDKGGNDVKVKWFWENSNLHRVWDSGMIDKKQYSYSELADRLKRTSKRDIIQLQAASVLDWANESKSFRKQYYDLPEDNSINYNYMYQHWSTVELRLLQAGVRLAGILEDIYG
ncbi:S1/P1 nuclease [Fulvivirga sp. M361]|uniref:S1/P1 nuclease n=1 Tax=Fulvivirga sp. M361 TaxID=2594266 RepID=UPI00117B8866|nr:S1/P1 nuclease [Fulvivirga sp. M361]TRX59397.1 S1/P1 nuclease [Fulvivirga sp. M361]